jgi:natural product precursor
VKNSAAELKSVMSRVNKNILKMKKIKFEDINLSIFQSLDVEKMKRIKGGYTLSTVTCYSSGNNQTDGSACSDGYCND